MAPVTQCNKALKFFKIGKTKPCDIWHKNGGDSYKHFRGPHKVVAAEVTANFSLLMPQIC